MQQEIFGVKKKDKLNGVWKQTRHEVTQNFLQLTLKLHIPKNYKTNAIIIKAKDWKYKTDNCTYYITSSASRQDELNRALFLATQVGKMEPSCPLGTTHCIPQAKFHQKPYGKSFIDQVCSVKMVEYWPRSFFASLLTSTSSRSINTQKKNLANIQPSWPQWWWFFEWFSEDFRRLSKLVLKARWTFSDIFQEFPKISKDCQRLSRKNWRCFDDTPTNLSTI